MGAKYNVLVVDDSDLTREALRRALELDPALKVIGEARTGEEAVELSRSLKPHLVTMDLTMPGMGGLKAIEALLAERKVPVVVISERSPGRGEDLNYEAIRRGALELVPKAEVFGGDSASTRRFAEKMRLIAEGGFRPIVAPAKAPVAKREPLPQTKPRRALHIPKLIAIGASTGGPRALSVLLSALPEKFPIPIVVVQHMAPEFFDSFVRFLDEKANLTVVPAEDGRRLEPGYVFMGPPGRDLHVDASLLLALDAPRGEPLHCPSADELFASVAHSTHGRAVGVLLTGMGSDGARGLLSLKKNGGFTVVQDESTSAVFGMPAAALAMGAAEEVHPIHDIAQVLISVAGPFLGPGGTRSSPSKPTPEGAASAAAPNAKKKVLLVDDSRLVLDAARITLEEAGYEVRTLDNPLMVAMHLRRDPVDLVLLDVNMPTVKGTQVAEVLRSRGGAPIPVVLFSDLDEKTLAQRAKECGAVGYLTKARGADPSELVRTVAKWLRKPLT